MEKIKLAISPCPNDTFIFGALIRKDINVPFEFDVVMEDIQFMAQIVIWDMVIFSLVDIIFNVRMTQ